MIARAESAAATRDRIIVAAMGLQSERGALGTGWDDIAARAGVSTATVYRHFPSLDELVPACAETVFHLSGLPTPEQADRIFAGLDAPAARLERLIRGTCECYAKAEGWLHAARRESDLVPAMQHAVDVQRRSMDILVRAALRGSTSRRTVKVLVALTDFPFWKSLKDCGLGDRVATDVVVQLARAQLSDELKEDET
jgi:AcrR family transcriptional regulator